MPFEGRYEFAKTTQRFVRLVHMVKAIRRSPMPYIYLTKEQYAELGGRIPNEGEPRPTTIITVTEFNNLEG